MNVTSESQSLVANVLAAFSETHLRPSMTIQEAEQEGVFESDQEWESIRNLDQERVWWEVPAEKYESCYNAAIDLDDESFRFYLPGYIVWTLTSGQQSQSQTIDYLMSRLSSTSTIKSLHLTKLQASVLKAYLKFIVKFNYLDAGREASKILQQFTE